MIAVPARVKVVLDLITRAAAAGAPCPSNNDIAFVLDAQSVSAGTNAIALLESMGIIKVHRNNSSRVVEIIATGMRTAGAIRAPHWRLRPENRAWTDSPSHRRESKMRPTRYTYNGTTRNRVFVPAEPLPPAIDREPCERCGARADIGCVHRPFWTDERDAELMDLASDDLDFTQIGIVMGVHSESAAARFEMLRLQMGAQAA